ncbi:uncharacterized protein LOC121255406 [Juglans microcarpa x Juglans regia]|uniref:uncharacterized protein LOC121255406 n=1 Tax=Juglans microcarpa x Juglans regia TaxID=2249226 RepID=UPI001B7DBA47|nr:uncharacterized protein LOC121255406 [Juglans microcarpa x Juglans regia]
MENYSFTSYPDSGDSSPRSREIDFENPPPWDDQQSQNNYKVKFMCSYGGKIHPRPHDNQLSYLGGETKILAVDRNVKFEPMISKLSSLSGDPDVSFKYQLPGEDLDALISVTNDDDLDHMMHEYDRLYRASAKPARMRLFLFSSPSANQSASSSFGSDGARSDRERFMDALNSGPNDAPKAPARNDVDYLFGLDKGTPPPQAAVKLQDSLPEPVAPPPPEFSTRMAHGDRVTGSDPVVNPIEMQRQLQELQRLHIGEHEPGMMYSRKSDENQVGNYSGDYYVPKVPEKTPPANVPHATAFWQEKQFAGGGFPASAQDQPMYMMPAPGTVYHAAPQMVRAMGIQNTQGYYTMQRVSPDVYRDQPQQQVYNVVAPPPSQQPPMSNPPSVLPPQQAKMSAYTEGFGMVRPGGGGVGMMDTVSYAPVTYDGGMGRQVYYTPATATYHGGVGATVTADMRAAGSGQEGKVVNKVSQASV